MNTLEYDAELMSLLKRVENNHYASKIDNEGESRESITEKDFLIYNPVELVKMSFPEKKIDSSKWTRSYGGYSLTINQIEDKRSVPYGLSAREIFEYFYNNFNDRQNKNQDQPHLFKFNSISEFVKTVKRLPKATKVSLDQRLTALQMLLNIESSTIRVIGSADERQTATNNPIFRSYSGPMSERIDDAPGTITDGEIYIELDLETFKRLSSSKRVPTKAYHVELAGSNVTARDLCIYIGYQAYRIKKYNTPFVEISTSELRQILGKADDYETKYFNRDIKTAIVLLQENFKNLYPGQTYPAEIKNSGRDNIVIRIENKSSIASLIGGERKSH